jgi:hypothetical protein
MKPKLSIIFLFIRYPQTKICDNDLNFEHNVRGRGHCTPCAINFQVYIICSRLHVLQNWSRSRSKIFSRRPGRLTYLTPEIIPHTCMANIAIHGFTRASKTTIIRDFQAACAFFAWSVATMLPFACLRREFLLINSHLGRFAQFLCFTAHARVLLLARGEQTADGQSLSVK